ncbi:MAG: RNB domain-containing ribonuclease [Spirochaetia bacterium]|jgi:exoribonuclease-2|nr:RNB domain-containing ribonuclease [Spirochaetia bacterium]
MVPLSSLVLYKRSINRVVSYGDGKLLVENEAGEQKKLREKDILLIHPGPVNKIPQALDGGDFKTAHAMLMPEEEESPRPVNWQDLAELVFEEFSPQAAVSCLQEVLRGKLFILGEAGPLALSFAEIEKAQKKEEERQNAEQRRSDFIQAFKAAKSKQAGTLQRNPEQASFIAELEAFALGRQERCPLASVLGISETIESVHKALIDAGLWEASFNPWPLRAQAVLYPPRLSFPAVEQEPVLLQRKDLRALRSLAIDNSWSKDPDDAIGFQDGEVWVHVADPAAFFGPDSEIDKEALSRGATLYLPERTVPMLPHQALERTGLGLSEESPALSFCIRISEEGFILETSIFPSLVKVERLSYEAADDLLEAGDELLLSMDRIARLRHRRRCANGAVDIDLPETSIRVDKAQPRFYPLEPTRSSAVVREFMLLAGEAAGRWAKERDLPFVYSSQEAPQLPASLSLCNRGADDEPGDGSKDLDGENSISLAEQYRRRKGMRASITGTEALAHRGLGLSFYSQVTSPLRRYQDLLSHYQIRAWLTREQGSGGVEKSAASPVLSTDEISRRCILAGQASAYTRQAERDSRLHWITWHVANNPGLRVKAVVLEVRERDAWVLIPELGYECAVGNRPALEPDQWIELTAQRAYLPGLELSFERADITQ